MLYTHLNLKYNPYLETGKIFRVLCVNPNSMDITVQCFIGFISTRARARALEYLVLTHSSIRDNYKNAIRTRLKNMMNIVKDNNILYAIKSVVDVPDPLFCRLFYGLTHGDMQSRVFC